MERPRIHPALLVALVATLGALVWLNAADAPSEDAIPTETFLRERIYVIALALDAEYEETGSYPTDLESVGLDEEGVVYSTDGRSYALTAEEDGISIAYRSGEDLAPFRAAFQRLLPPFPEGA